MDKEKDGVWRTIRGRRIFIGKDEDLATAMKNSGKFNNQMSRVKKNKDKYDIIQKAKNFDRDLKKTNRERYDIDKSHEKDKWEEQEKYKARHNTKEAQRYEKNEYKKMQDFKAKKQSNNKIDNKQFEVSELKQKALERLPKEDIDTHDSDLYIKKTKESEALISNMKDKDSGLLTTFKDQNTGETWYDIPFANMSDDFKEKQSNNKIESNDKYKVKKYGGTYIALKNGHNEGEFKTEKEAQNYLKKIQSNNKVDPYDDPESNESQRLQSIQSRYDEYLQDTEGRGASYGEIAHIEELRGKDLDDFEKELDDYETKKYNQEDVKSLEKVVKRQKAKQKDKNDWLPKATEIKEQGTSNRKQVSDNIQAHILSYYDKPEDFIHQMDVMKQPTNWHNGMQLAKGGSYLIYYDDQRKFLDDLKINPSNKKFNDDRVFETYSQLIGRESAKLYDKIKKHQAETINNYKKRKGK